MNTNEIDIEIGEKLKTLIKEQGISVFHDSRKLGAVIADYIAEPRYSDEVKLLRRIASTGLLSFAASDSREYESSRSKAAYILTRREFISQEWVDRALFWIDYATGHAGNAGTDSSQEPEENLLDLLVRMSQAEAEEKTPKKREPLLSPIDMLLDENNTDNIVLYNEENQEVEFEQIALVPLDDRIYAILKPVDRIEGIADDEALVFVIDEIDDEECLAIVEDDSIVDAVFEEYYRMLEED